MSKELLEKPTGFGGRRRSQALARSRHQIVISGQTSKIEGLGLIVGLVGKEVDEDKEKKSA